MVDPAEVLSSTSNLDNTDEDVNVPPPLRGQLGGPTLSMADSYKASIIFYGHDMNHLQDVAACVRNEQGLTETEKTELISLVMDFLRRGPRQM